jgi:hypothetical protein
VHGADRLRRLLRELSLPHPGRRSTSARAALRGRGRRCRWRISIPPSRSA